MRLRCGKLCLPMSPMSDPDTHSLAAAAITPRALAWLHRNAAATILHVSPHTCNLVDTHGDILTLVTPKIGRGPFTVVVPVDSFRFQVSGFKSPVPSPQSQISQSHNLAISQSPPFPSYLITFDQAELWEPRPQWDALRPHLAKAIPWLRLALLRHTPTHAAAIHQLPRFVTGVEQFCQGWQHQDEVEIFQAVDRLAGFGPGMTPAGDDGLMGIMYGAWAAQPQPDESLLHRAAAQAGAQTTTLSRAFLAAAAEGEAVQAWHELVEAIRAGEAEAVVAAAQGILAIGDSSGACALAGFLTMVEVSVHYL